MARPVKLADEKRLARYNLRFTTAEQLHIVQQARRAGLETAEYLRRRALGYQVPPAPSRVDAQLLAELNRLGMELKAVGVLCNQLARAAHTGRDAVIAWSTVYEQVHATRSDVAVLLDRLALIGSDDETHTP